jgi:hypothetical protein
LSEVGVRPVIDSMADESLANAVKAAEETTAVDAFMASSKVNPSTSVKAAEETTAVDALATATVEAEDNASRRRNIGDLSYFRRVLGFFGQGEAIARLLLLAGMDAGMWWLISGGTVAAGDAGFGQAFTVVYILAGLLIFVPLALGTLANTFSITADTASGSEFVENWPEDIFSEWIGHAITMFVIIVVAGLPGSILSITTRGAFGQAEWAFLATGLVMGCSLAIVFPIILLSVLEGDGLGSMISPPVISSLVIAKKSWALFYVESTAICALMLPAIMVINSSNIFLLLVASIWKYVLVFVYYRLVGVVGFRVAERLNEHHSNVLDEPDDQ